MERAGQPPFPQVYHRQSPWAKGSTLAPSKGLENTPRALRDCRHMATQLPDSESVKVMELRVPEVEGSIFLFFLRKRIVLLHDCCKMRIQNSLSDMVPMKD